jgi:hypothetical protein
MGEYEAGSQALNPHLMEVLTENPTDGLDLLERSLEHLQRADGVPEYDDILSVKNDWVDEEEEEAGSVGKRRGRRRGGGGSAQG